ncbi:MAG TPA: hypothetical protein VNO70_13435 [Blastocatellia bacterium]|nr:hypothetical protein [Blastocatellia bacterium]
MKTLYYFLMLFVFTAAPARAQEQEENDPAKAEALIREAIKARGGDAYMNIRSLVGRGQYTPFEKGVSGLPSEFVDYIAYPDRERTEFGKGKTKFIQTNVGNTGWIYDAPQKMIRDQTEEQVKNFQQGMRYDLDMLLRRAWQEPGAKLVYLGRREAWRNVFSEAARIEFADGAFAVLHFDRNTKLPMMIEYKSVREAGTTDDQVRYFRWVDYNGIKFPTLQDFYSNGQQRARVSYDSVEFNVATPDKLFAKPADIKEVK